MFALKTAILATSGTVAAWLAAFSPEPADQLYFLVARGSGKCLQLSSTTQDNGTRIVQWSCANRTNFKLRKIERRDGSFYLQFAHTAKCLNVNDAYLANGTAFTQRDCHGSAQRWRARPASDGYVFLVSEASGKCIGLSDGSKADGEAITQWECAKRPDMMWKMVPTK